MSEWPDILTEQSWGNGILFGEGRKIIQKSTDRWCCKSNVKGKTKNGLVKGFSKNLFAKKQESVFTATAVIMPKKVLYGTNILLMIKP